jgi:hypothetical protein
VAKYISRRTCSLGSSSCQRQAAIYCWKVNLHWAVASTLEAYQEGKSVSLFVHYCFLSNSHVSWIAFLRIQLLPKDRRLRF